MVESREVKFELWDGDNYTGDVYIGEILTTLPDISKGNETWVAQLNNKGAADSKCGTLSVTWEYIKI